MKLLIASHNQNKISEIKDIFSDLAIEILSLEDIGFRKKVEETGKSYEENAILKAEYMGRKAKMLTLAEDSGLEVDFLEGRPGIYSARYEEGDDRNRIDKLLKELQGIPKEKRKAKFIAFAAVYDPVKNKTKTFQGESEGYICKKPFGTSGFGYDPVFFNNDLGKTNAKVSKEEKNRVSHRGKALGKAKEYLVRIMNQES